MVAGVAPATMAAAAGGGARLESGTEREERTSRVRSSPGSNGSGRRRRGGADGDERVLGRARPARKGATAGSRERASRLDSINQEVVDAAVGLLVASAGSGMAGVDGTVRRPKRRTGARARVSGSAQGGKAREEEREREGGTAAGGPP